MKRRQRGVSFPEGGQGKFQAFDKQRAKAQPQKLTSQPVLPAQKTDPIATQATEQKHPRFMHLGLSCISLPKPQMVFYSQILLFTEECKT